MRSLFESGTNGLCMLTKIICLVARSPKPCGVEAFGRQLCAELARAGHGATEVAVSSVARHLRGLWRDLRDAEALLVNLPVVAWKRRVLTPTIELLLAKLRRRRSVLILHEWADLNWKRRWTYAPCVLLADTILFSSPLVRGQFEASPISAVATRETGLVPIPPNLQPPAIIEPTPLSRRIAQLRGEGVMIVAQFGSIYPHKNSVFLLEVAAALKESGAKVCALFIGSFIAAGDRVEEDFRARVAELGLDAHVIVTGYLEQADIFAAFREVDAFLYYFKEGLTSRRGSVLACLFSGAPVYANAPFDAREFDHHPAYRAQIDHGGLRLLGNGLSAGEVAQILLQERSVERGGSPPDYERCWQDAASAVSSALPEQRGRQVLQAAASTAAGGGGDHY